MAKPLIPADDILTHALDLLDSEGIEALSVRRLSAALKISPRTLYQQVGNREALIRALVARHFAHLKLDFKEYDTWESTALHWCLALNNALRAHPFLTELMTITSMRCLKRLCGRGFHARWPLNAVVAWHT
jgi:AcrR family transcriptional regulator